MDAQELNQKREYVFNKVIEYISSESCDELLILKKMRTYQRQAKVLTPEQKQDMDKKDVGYLEISPELEKKITNLFEFLVQETCYHGFPCHDVPLYYKDNGALDDNRNEAVVKSLEYAEQTRIRGFITNLHAKTIEQMLILN